MKELKDADVAHFAAHYVAEAGIEMLSQLVLAPEKNQSSGSTTDGLTSADVYGMKLSRTKLVVLSACETGIERSFRGEGPISFARPFLVAGVPTVVASLWAVDSEATAQLMIQFHRFRKAESFPTVDALRRAQLAMLQSDNPRWRQPYYWAGFVPVGGRAD
jgi:CHAT domain-containing protein